MLKLRDIMTPDVMTLSPDTTLRDAVELLAAHEVSGAPVVAGARVVGVVSASDILSFQSSTEPVPAERPDQEDWGDPLDEAPDWQDDSEPPATFFTELWADAGADADVRFATSATAEWDLLAEHTVAEAMSRTVRALPPETDVEDAADLMQRERIHRVLVMERGALLGIVTAMDVLRAVAEHRLTVRQYVFDRHGGDDERDSDF